MKTRILCVLWIACFLHLAQSQSKKCDLTGGKRDVPFPDINKYTAESYMMGVEYTVTNSNQTDYYTEYYDDAFRKGRLETHINKENKVYIYYVDTYEIWTLQNDECKLGNTSEVLPFEKDVMTDWKQFDENMTVTTIGPSAMFKIASAVWAQKDSSKMAFMGSLDDLIRGERVIYWRRCINDNSFIDYFFADPEEENPYDSDVFSKEYTPLRVAMYGVSPAKELAEQFYDIMHFQPYIPKGVKPFQLPKGKNCTRGWPFEGPKFPDFSNENIFLSAEVVYKKYSTSDGRKLLSSYYSTLMFALDFKINHVAYYYSSWNTTKPDKDHQEPFANLPEYMIYDTLHQYTYRINYETMKCEISRDSSNVPQYKLPEDAGSLSLTDNYVFRPNNEFYFLTEGTDRGLPVNIFEAAIQNYTLDKTNIIPRVIATHSFFKPNEEVENVAAVKSAPSQIELRFFRKKNMEEVLTLNIFGFSTRMDNKQFLFDVRRCFKNDDDYLFLTIGFQIEPRYLKVIPKNLPEIEREVMTVITRETELNPVRIPKTMVDFKNDYVYVTLVILGTPTRKLDFPDDLKETGKTIEISDPNTDTQGVSNFETCANKCLEEIDSGTGCWGFSMCGSSCYFGSSKNTKVKVNEKCALYRRYSNSSAMPSKENQAQKIVGLVEGKQFSVMIVDENDGRATVPATFAEVTDPAEDDSLFEKMGNLLNPRMRVLKAGVKLNKGSLVKNMGRLRYDECQSLCLDFKDCETLSYCLSKEQRSECVMSDKYGADLVKLDMQDDDLCILLTRKYTDHFDRTPGVFVKVDGHKQVEAANVEDCARACLKYTSFKCLSFDHCGGGDKKGCTLYSVHFLNPEDRKQNTEMRPSCGHYSRKYSNDFKKKDNTRIVGSKVDPIMNLTLEECAKTCVEYGEGTCYGYDFCQVGTLYSTSCTLIDKDPSRLNSAYSEICTNYVRTDPAYAPRPYTNSYAGGIGFLCFLVGGLLGAAIVFIIAYIRVKRNG